jgi:glycosyltransferase involved in cell wall biosynthesis
MSSREPLISVIIPAYNYGHLLPRALDSVLAQWADDLELIVVDDGSRDNTAEVLAGFAARYPHAVRVVRQDNAGAASARNHGIRLASGRFALLLDADDELLPNALDSLRQVLADHPQAGLILGAQISVYPDGRERLRLPTQVPESAAPRALIQRYLLEKKISISHGCTLFRRQLLLQRPYPENLRTGEDIPVFAYLLVRAEVAVSQQPLARIHKHADSLRHSRADEEGVAQGMVREVFASLPEECQPLRKRYQAQRYLSLFRAAALAHDRLAARRFYWQALKLYPPQALRWSYVRKALRILIGL